MRVKKAGMGFDLWQWVKSVTPFCWEGIKGFEEHSGEREVWRARGLEWWSQRAYANGVARRETRTETGANDRWDSALLKASRWIFSARSSPLHFTSCPINVELYEFATLLNPLCFMYTRAYSLEATLPRGLIPTGHKSTQSLRRWTSNRRGSSTWRSQQVSGSLREMAIAWNRNYRHLSKDRWNRSP